MNAALALQGQFNSLRASPPPTSTEKGTAGPASQPRPTARPAPPVPRPAQRALLSLKHQVQEPTRTVQGWLQGPMAEGWWATSGDARASAGSEDPGAGSQLPNSLSGLGPAPRTPLPHLGPAGGGRGGGGGGEPQGHADSGMSPARTRPGGMLGVES